MAIPERDYRKGRFLLPSTFLTLVMAAVALTNPAVATGASLSDKVTDGHPWKMTTGDGHTGTLVLFHNGTGKMTGGPMELSPKWRPTPEGLCLKPGMLLPERCVKLVLSENGYIGLKDGKEIFKLER